MSVEPSSEPSEAPTPEPTPLPSGEPVTLTFEGAGAEVTEEFPLPAANYLVEWKVTSGPCTVDFTLLLDDYDDRYPVGHAATNDTTNGQYRVFLPEGYYKLEAIDPGCEWTVNLTEQ